jgi:hypothetical protein
MVEVGNFLNKEDSIKVYNDSITFYKKKW